MLQICIRGNCCSVYVRRRCPCRSLRQRRSKCFLGGRRLHRSNHRHPCGSTRARLGEAGYYVQAGPAIVAADGAENSSRISGKAGIGVPVTDALSAYGELSFITAEDEFLDDLGVGGKLGVKYNF